MTMNKEDRRPGRFPHADAVITKFAKEDLSLLRCLGLIAQIFVATVRDLPSAFIDTVRESRKRLKTARLK